jgi:hypothetical protein
MCTVARHRFNPKPALINAVAPVASAGAGIQELEDSVFGFLYSHAGVLKLMAVVDDMTRMLSQVAACLSQPLCEVQVKCFRRRVLGRLSLCAVLLLPAVMLQMANSMAVSEGALVQDVAVVQVSILLGAELLGHNLHA